MGMRETPGASHFVCFGFDFEARVHYVSPSGSELIYSIAQLLLDVTIFLSLPSRCKDYRCSLSHPADGESS